MTSATAATSSSVATHVLPAWGLLDDGEGRVPASHLAVAPLSGGLINDTFAVGRHFVLQRLHRIFAPTVNDDIAALVPQLQAAGVSVPSLVRTANGDSCVVVQTGDAELDGCWRMLSRLHGQTLHKLPSAKHARSAGRLVGSFHRALLPVQHTFAFTRPGAHDTPLHMANLAAALAEHPHHRLTPQLAPLAHEIAARWASFGPIPQLPQRIVHGDLKVSNLLFHDDAAVSVLDLDTMAWGTLDVELGDALRSWCNRGAEDDAEPSYDAAIHAEALGGWLDSMGDVASEAERRSLARGALRITLELSARFAADTLRESYFGWDRTRYPAAGEHNLVRARNQLGLARDLERQLPRLEAALA